MEKELERELRRLIQSKIRFGTQTAACGIEKFDSTKREHRDEVIDRIIHLAEQVFGGSGPNLKSHRHLSDSWTVVYTTVTGAKARKNYISPIEVLSPFRSDAITEVEIIYAGSED